jgi:hypothetical protein
MKDLLMHHPKLKSRLPNGNGIPENTYSIYTYA